MKVSESGGFKERILISSNQFHPHYNTKSERKKLAFFLKSNLLDNFVGDKRDLCFKKCENSKRNKIGVSQCLNIQERSSNFLLI